MVTARGITRAKRLTSKCFALLLARNRYMKSGFKNIGVKKDFGNQDKIIKKYMPKLKILDGKSILVMIVDLLESAGNYAESDSYKKAVDNLMQALEEKFSNDFLIKPHPRESKLYGKMSESENIIPPYIPAEFLMNHKWKFIIGIVSSSLVYAAKNTDIVVISFMDLFKWNRKASREKNIWRKEMEDVGILFPKDINELKRLLLEDNPR